MTKERLLRTIDLLLSSEEIDDEFYMEILDKCLVYMKGTMSTSSSKVSVKFPAALDYSKKLSGYSVPVSTARTKSEANSSAPDLLDKDGDFVFKGIKIPEKFYEIKKFDKPTLTSKIKEFVTHFQKEKASGKPVTDGNIRNYFITNYPELNRALGCICSGNYEMANKLITEVIVHNI